MLVNGAINIIIFQKIELKEDEMHLFSLILSDIKEFHLRSSSKYSLLSFFFNLNWWCWVLMILRCL
jgi:hypothetical protein